MEHKLITKQQRKTLFAELLLPVPVPKLFTYRVPLELNDKIGIGQRAIVHFGDRRILTGIITKIHENPPTSYEAKYILDVLDEEAIMYEQQFAFYQWIADYYLCSAGEVLNAALPSGLKLSSESMVQLHPSFDWETTLFDYSEKETLLITHLGNGAISYSEISTLLGIKHIYSILKSLTSKEAILLFEKVKEKFKPKTEKRIRLSAKYLQHRVLEELFAELSSKAKQEEILLKYLQDVPVLHDPGNNKKGISKSELLNNGLSPS